MFYSPLEQFDIIVLFYGCVNCFDSFCLDITFFNIFIPLCLFIGYMLVISYFFKDYLKIVPTVYQLVMEKLISFIFNLIKSQIGKEGYVYYPFLLTIFLFILIVNLLGLLPFGIALTSHLIPILLLSLTSCLAIFVIGLYEHKLKFLFIFIPKSPFILLPMLIIIEIFSYIIRMFSLAIRLAANIMAGHTLVFIIVSFILSVVGVSAGLFFLSSFILMLVLCLELGVAFLQAYVFTVLLCIYLNDSIKGGH